MNSTQIKYFLEAAMLWIESGVGVGFINSMNNLILNPNIVLLDRLPCKNTYNVMVWKNDNINPSLPLFTNRLLEKIEN